MFGGHHHAGQHNFHIRIRSAYLLNDGFQITLGFGRLKASQAIVGP